MAIKKAANAIVAIGKAFALGMALANMSPEIRQTIQAAIYEQARREQEAIQAAAMGVTIEQFRVIQSLPADWIDWAKVGNR